MTVLEAYPWVGERFCGVTESKGGARVAADCPIKCHRSARMSFALGAEGQLLLKCWAGCDRLEALRCVGCGWRDCFPGKLIPDRVKRTETCYPYHDEDGRVLYQAVRLEPGYRGKDKAFFRRRPRPGGGWVNDLEGVRLVPYRLRELLAADPHETVHLVAGEKDANLLAALGLIATTNIGGENAPWIDGYGDLIGPRHVVVVEDRDSAGTRRANELCGALMRTARSIRRVVLPAKDSAAFIYGLRANGVTAPADLRDYFVGATDEVKRWEPFG